MAALLFIPAWTLDYWQAWAFLAVFGVSSLAITLYLMKKDPKLLERRVYAGPTAEKEPSQKIIQTITSLGFIAMLVVAALDHRLHWSEMSLYVAVAGDVLVAIGFLIVFFVYKENTFASATIELAPEQKVISTGLYALVRHPMYMGAFSCRRHVSFAWLVVGIISGSPLIHARAYMENFRRGKVPDKESPGLLGIRER